MQNHAMLQWAPYYDRELIVEAYKLRSVTRGHGTESAMFMRQAKGQDVIRYNSNKNSSCNINYFHLKPPS